MPSSQTVKRAFNRAGISTVGIDVGGSKKGFHAVALTNGEYSDQLDSNDINALVRWCREMKAQVIAVDAPCRWSPDGGARPAEIALGQNRIFCFSTPTRETADKRRHLHLRGKATDHYGWILNGALLFDALESFYPICRALPPAGRQCCFETFPHAITWHMRGGHADAKKKRGQRRALLEEAGIDITELTNIDLVDAALCALTAYHVAIGNDCDHFGEPDTGLVIVPKCPTR